MRSGLRFSKYFSLKILIQLPGEETTSFLRAVTLTPEKDQNTEIHVPCVCRKYEPELSIVIPSFNTQTCRHSNEYTNLY